MDRIDLRGEVGISMTLSQLHMLLTIKNHARENVALLEAFWVVSWFQWGNFGLQMCVSGSLRIDRKYL